MRTQRPEAAQRVVAVTPQYNDDHEWYQIDRQLVSDRLAIRFPTYDVIVIYALDEFDMITEHEAFLFGKEMTLHSLRAKATEPVWGYTCYSGISRKCGPMWGYIFLTL